MSRAAEGTDRRRGTNRRLPRGTWTTLGIAATVVAATLTALPPAVAVHQACGEKYPSGTLSNGHPDTNTDLEGWTGVPVLQSLENTSFALGSAKEVTTAVGDTIDAGGKLNNALEGVILMTSVEFHNIHAILASPFGVAQKTLEIVAKVMYVAALVMTVAKTAIDSATLAVGADVGTEDACNGVLAGDMIDALWIALVERNLGAGGPPPAILLMPHDSQTDSTGRVWPLRPQRTTEEFEWCPAIERPDPLPPSHEGGGGTGGAQRNLQDSCPAEYHLGFLDAPDIGVKAVTTNAVAHAKAHGLDVRNADACLTIADQLLAADDYKQAFAYYRNAYQAAMSTVHPSVQC